MNLDDSAETWGGAGRERHLRGAAIAPATEVAPMPWQACAIVLVLAMLFGGSTYQRGWPDAVVQITSLPLLVLLLPRIPALWSISSIHRAALAVSGLMLLLPLFQLIPLPPLAWTFLPGRGPVAEGLLAAGISLPWMPISLSPSETWRSALALLPPLAVFLAAAGLDRGSRRSLVLVLLGLAGLNLMVGMAQVSAGASGLFRFYGPGAEAVGFFLNRNHLAALLYAMIPFTAAWIAGLASDSRPQTKLILILAAVLLACFVLGLGMTRSRAGLLLAVLACLAALALTRERMSATGKPLARRLIAAGGFIGLMLLLQFAAIGLLQRATADPLADERWANAALTFRAALDFLPFGSGFGTFDSVFKSYETAGLLQESYLNNAHNDYAELALEGGVPAVVLVALFLTIFVPAVARAWRPDEKSHALDLALRRAAGISASLLLVHSAVDYPLRSAALATLFALACALLLPSPSEAARESRLRSRREKRATAASTDSHCSQPHRAKRKLV